MDPSPPQATPAAPPEWWIRAGDISFNIPYNSSPPLNNYFIQSISPIQSMIIHGNKKVISAMDELRNSGFDVKAIRQPTIPEGKERIRICLHTYNSDHEIKELVKILERISKH